MSQFQELYGKICNTPISWSDLVNMVLIVSNMLVEIEHEMHIIKNTLKITHDRKKYYADQNKDFKCLKVREHVYFHNSPKKISLRINHVPSCHLFIVVLSRSLRGFDQWPRDLHCF